MKPCRPAGGTTRLRQCSERAGRFGPKRTAQRTCPRGQEPAHLVVGHRSSGRRGPGRALGVPSRGPRRRGRDAITGPGKASPLGLRNGMLLVAGAHTLALTFGIFTAKFPLLEHRLKDLLAFASVKLSYPCATIDGYDGNCPAGRDNSGASL